jgi:hypothetical protein
MSFQPNIKAGVVFAEGSGADNHRIDSGTQ